MRKFQCLSFVLKRSYICYYVICMTVPLSNNFVNGISEVINLDADVQERNFKDDLTAKTYDECNITLKTIRSDNVNKLTFAHLNVNSIRNKFLAT